MRGLLFILVLFVLTSCWPTKISFVDGNMPEEWKTYYVTPLENNAANAPLNYSATLSEAIRNGIQNNTRLLIDSDSENAQITIEGTISNYTIAPVALQEDDNAAKNRLSITVRFEIFISAPEEEQIALTSSRFVDYDVSADIATVESELLTDINTQIVQDVINKLMSNW
ncbi:MAG: LPS assembly lipoprotein LptE [Crocinitomicaceae bacterium]|jgi:outer membrane lipopolysaccharide assembly protein LptE/RlpB|nr:LPS assembly lipoprotein LptE [Crocinitomicaceae bacterium]